MRVGLLYDFLGVVGGAELNIEAYKRSAPDDVIIVDCPPGRPLPACDVYVVGNCTMYAGWITTAFEGKRVIKIVSDLWRVCEDGLRTWLLDNAEPLLVSPVLAEVAEWRFAKRYRYAPSVIDLDAFRIAAANSQQRAGACWVGRCFASKGIAEAQAWASENELPLDIYGEGPDKPADGKGLVVQSELPQTLARYEWFVFLPREFDPCPRSVIEAWAAGCKLVLNGQQGASWWIEHNPAALEDAAGLFWRAVLHEDAE